MKKIVFLFTAVVLMAVLASRLVLADQIKIFDSRQDWIKHTFVTSLDPKTWGEFAAGDLYVRYHIIGKPSSIEVDPMLCLWQGNYGQPGFCETCTKREVITKFSDEGFYYAKIGGQTAGTGIWNAVYGSGHNASAPTDRVMHQWWVKKNGRWVVLRADHGESYDYGAGVDAHIPIDFEATGILVKKGTTFYPPADWTNCPSGWGCGAGIPQTPYGGTKTLPGKIEAEDYDNGGEGVAYHDGSGDNKYGEYRGDDVDITTTTDGGSGYKVKAEGAEWLEYTANVTGGTYDVVARVSTPRDGGNTMGIKIGTKSLGTKTIPNTGAWETFTNLIWSNVTLAGGTGQVMRIDTDGIGWNINYIEVVPAGTATAIRDIRDMPALQYRAEHISIYRMDGTLAADGTAARTADLAPGMYLVVDRSSGRPAVQKMMHVVK